MVARLAGAIATAAALALPSAAPAATTTQLVDTCRASGLSTLLTPVCRTAQQATSGVAAACRTLTAASEACRLPATPTWSRAEVDAAANGWVAQALGRQSRLADGLGFADAPWVSTHNSFNSIAEMGPTLSALDANQQLTLVDQLRIGIRSLELDLHWAHGGALGPMVCHATGPHVGCTVEKALEAVLRPVAGWLAANPSEVVLLYLENKLDGAAGEGTALAAIQRTIGTWVFRANEAGACTKLPLEGLTRDTVRAAGKQVVLVSNGCGANWGWRNAVHDWRDRDEERPQGFRPYPACGPHTPGLDRLVRYYEDGTAVTAVTSLAGAATIDDGVTPPTAKALVDCGVDIVGFDHLVPSDGKLEAVVWSWARGEPAPAGGDCASLRADGRWAARSCTAAAQPAACVAADGSWSLSAPTTAAGAAAACAATGRTHAVPRTGYEGTLLRTAAASTPAWLGLRRGEPGF